VGGSLSCAIKKRTANSRICRTPPSQNICTCWWVLRFTFDHSSYSKKLWKCYLFCYDMFYHRIHFKYIIIIFVFSQILYFYIFANTLVLYFRKNCENVIYFVKMNSQMWSVKIKGCKYFGTEGVRLKKNARQTIFYRAFFLYRAPWINHLVEVIIHAHGEGPPGDTECLLSIMYIMGDRYYCCHQLLFTRHRQAPIPYPMQYFLGFSTYSSRLPLLAAWHLRTTSIPRSLAAMTSAGPMILKGLWRTRLGWPL
jgi:hypothetical protein